MDGKKKVPEVRFKGFGREWTQQQVGDYYDFKNGLNKGKEFFGFGIPIVNFTDVFHNRGIKAEKLQGRVELTKSEIANFNVKQGDIFFTRTSETINEIGYPSVMLDSPTNTVFSGFVLRARAIKDDPMTLSFKQYVFFTNAFRSEMIKKSSMTTRALTSGTAIKRMIISFPLNKEEQSYIGLTIQNLDHLITLQQKKHNKLTNIKKAMLEKMFPKNGADVPEIRFKGFERKWEERTLGEVIDVRSGRDYKHLSDGKIPVYGTGGYMLSVNEALSYNDDAIGIGRKGTIDKPFILEAPFWTVDTLFYAVLSDNYDINFTYNIFQKIDWKQKSEATGVPSLSKVSINNHRTFFPIIEEQQKIGTYFQNLDLLITIQKTQIEKLNNIKKACLEKMFV